jgi:glycolate oxidase FAD binding subunit
VSTSTTPPTAGVRTERPRSVAEAAALLRDSTGGVLFRGAGTKMSWGGRAADPDIVVETGGLADLLEHNPSDMTAAVGAGMPLRTLQEHLADAGQWLALDPPTEPAGATIGGLLAAGDSGPRRLRYGALRDLVIGVTLVLADGTVARPGGHVIKNVAGYDLSKLVYGSLGSLGLVAEVVLRVHPRPESSVTLTARSSVSAAATVTLGLLASPLEPAAVDWSGDPREGAEPGWLAVRFEGSAAGVRAQAVVARDLLERAGLGCEELAAAEEADLWREFAEIHVAGPDRSTAFAGTLPSSLPAVAAAADEAAHAAGVGVELVSHTALGLHSARFSGAPPEQARAFESWRRAVVGAGGTVMLRDRPEEVDATVDALGSPPSAVALLRAVASALDPDRRCARGRFGSWF